MPYKIRIEKLDENNHLLQQTQCIVNEDVIEKFQLFHNKDAIKESFEMLYENFKKDIEKCQK